MRIQHGLVADHQVRECGVSVGRQRRLIERGVWIRYAPGVIADGGSPETWHRRARAATMAPGAHPILTGAAGARLHRLDGYSAVERIMVALPMGRSIRARSDVAVRRSRWLASTIANITAVEGIRVTTVAVTLIVLATDNHSGRVKALDSALRDGVSAKELRSTFEAWKGRGVRGPAEMLRLLHDRAEARLPRSWFQRLAGELLSRHGIAMVDEWPVYGERGQLLAETGSGGCGADGRCGVPELGMARYAGLTAPRHEPKAPSAAAGMGHRRTVVERPRPDGRGHPRHHQRARPGGSSAVDAELNASIAQECAVETFSSRLSVGGSTGAVRVR